MDKSKYFFCYSPTLHRFIHIRHKVKYVCAALNENDKRKFWLYERTHQLNNILTEYNTIFKGGDAT